MDAQVFVAHRAALEEQLPDNSLLFLFAGEPKQKTLDMDYPFRVDNNYYYMTGFDRANWFLMHSISCGALTRRRLLMTGPMLRTVRYGCASVMRRHISFSG